MLRRTILVLLTAILLLSTGLPANAQAELRLEIISPSVGERVRGHVPIIGSSIVPDFQFYKVEFGLGPNPGQWAVIGSLHDQPVTNNQLEVWNTAVLPDDVYTLRLTGVKNDGNWEEFYVRNIVVANSEPVEPPTPTATPTPEGEETPTPVAQTPDDQTPDNPTPSPEETSIPELEPGVQIIAPTAELSVPTATPAISQADAASDLPIDPESLGQSFCFGGLAMGAVFLLLGFIFGIRRLL